MDGIHYNLLLKINTVAILLDHLKLPISFLTSYSLPQFNLIKIKNLNGSETNEYYV